MKPCSFLLVLASLSTNAVAHSSDRGYVMLLPTNYYITGGTIAVLATVLLVGFIKMPFVASFRKWRFSVPLPSFMRDSSDGRGHFSIRDITSVCSTVLLTLLVLSGLIGSTDPLDNPLPLTIWTLGWVLLTLAHAVFGNIWAYINPWTGLVSLVEYAVAQYKGSNVNSQPLKGQRDVLPNHYRSLPSKLGYAPAIVMFASIAWFELVSLAPEDPNRLAAYVAIYWLFNFLAFMIFGKRQWLKRGEAFSVYFYFISLFSIFTRIRKTSGEKSNSVQIGLPGLRILEHPEIHWSAAFFILMTLATVSFDGLNKTFWWLHLHQINPLAFAGRSSVMWINSRGLTASVLALFIVYAILVWIGHYWSDSAWSKPGNFSVPRITGVDNSFHKSLGSFALCIIPISLAYHFAHYLSVLLVNGQYALKAFADPFNSGINLTGFSTLEVSTSFLGNHLLVERLWQIQVVAIVTGHIISVLITHLVALRLVGDNVIRSQLPLAILMILYTCFGLWLLATPTGL